MIIAAIMRLRRRNNYLSFSAIGDERKRVVEVLVTIEPSLPLDLVLEPVIRETLDTLRVMTEVNSRRSRYGAIDAIPLS